MGIIRDIIIASVITLIYVIVGILTRMNYIIFLTILGAWYVAVAIYLTRKRLIVIKRTKEDARMVVNDMRQQTNKLIEQLERLEYDEKGGKIGIRQIHIDNLPQKLQDEIYDRKTFIGKENILAKIFNVKTDKQEPYLFLIKENKEVEIKRKAKMGDLELTGLDNEKKRIKLSMGKILTLRWGKKDIKIMTAYEEEAEPYPHEPEHYSKSYYNTVEKILLTDKIQSGTGFKIKKGYILIGLILIILIILWKAFMGGGAEEVTTTATTVAPTIVTAVQNATASTIIKEEPKEEIKVVNII